jgi:hypothetical protein
MARRVIVGSVQGAFYHVHSRPPAMRSYRKVAFESGFEWGSGLLHRSSDLENVVDEVEIKKAM